MTGSDPLRYVWWLASRASGVVALMLVSLSVLLGLAMAAKVLRRPGLKRTVVRLHEHVALAALGAIAVHGLSLLGDGWLKPGLRGIAVPFALGYRPAFTGLGIIAGYLAMLVGPSFYLRRRLPAGGWRKLHRVSAVIWVLAVVHTLGSGSDASKLWLRCIVLIPVVPIAYLLTLRALKGTATQTKHAAGRFRSSQRGSSRPPERQMSRSAARDVWRASPPNTCTRRS